MLTKRIKYSCLIYKERTVDMEKPIQKEVELLKKSTNNGGFL